MAGIIEKMNARKKRRALESSQNEKLGWKDILKTVILVFCCVFINYYGKQKAIESELPLFLDSFGTVLAAYFIGPISGAIVGCAGNIIYSFWNISALYYGITSVFIGISIGLAARKKWFNSLFGAASVAGWVSVGSAAISTIPNLIFFHGSTGNKWGDGVRDYLIERGAPKNFAIAAGELYLDFLDKLVTVLALYLLLILIKMLRKLKNRKKIFGSGILALMICGSLFRGTDTVYADTIDETAYVQQVFDGDHGLPFGHVNDISQTNDGMLWVGSDSGLYRFNGRNFVQIKGNDNLKKVNCIYVDQEGRLWVGTGNNGLMIVINGEISNTLNSLNGLPYDSVKGITQSTDGDYYIGTTDGIAVVEIKNGISVSKLIPGIRNVQGVSADPDGNVAAVTAEGRVFVIKNREIRMEMPQTGRNTGFTACAFDENGVLYAGTTDGRIITFILGESGAEVSETITCGGNKINDISFDADTPFVLTERGIGTLKENVFRHMDTGDFNSAVEAMTVDYQGNLWFSSSRRGLLRLSETIFPNINIRYDLPTEETNTTCIKDDILYIGTNRGLSILDMSTGKSIQNKLTELLRETAVWCIIADSENRLWICADTDGLICVMPEGEIKVFDGRRYALISGVHMCTELSDGRIATGGNGVLKLIRNENNILSIPLSEEMQNSQILSICEQSDGRLFIGTNGEGIAVIKDEKVTEMIKKADGLASDIVWRIVSDEEDDKLFVVTDSGLNYINRGGISLISGIPTTEIYDIISDTEGEVFVLASTGIYAVRKGALLSNRRFTYTLVDFKSGFKGDLTENAWNERTEDRKLYLSTNQGVILFDMDHYLPEVQSYRLMVSEVRLDGKSFPAERGTELTVERDVEEIEFVSEVINFLPAEPKISYYLEGFDSGYKTVAQSDLSGIIYRNVPPGNYTFHLTIMDETNGRIREESTYGLMKKKAIFDNNWFLFYVFVVGILFIGWLSWFVTRFGVQRKIALQQERLSMALKQVQMGSETILAIAKAVDAKDARTSQHSQRVSNYSVLVSGELGFSEQEQENIKNAALVHDIGKIGIPDSILNKPARLTDEEYAIMKTHVTLGGEILKDVTFIDHVVEGAKYHHERYDGKGYPEGLQGKDIPLYGRIIAVADAFDAMTANRVYRKRQDFSYVMDELHKGKGTQFDPDILEIFLDLIEKGIVDIDYLYETALDEMKEEKA